MSTGPQVTLKQVGPTTSEGFVRGHSVLVDRPTEKGGDDRGPMGGELMLIGLGGCFLSNLYAAARERDVELSDVEVVVSARSEGTPPHFVDFEMRVSMDRDDVDLAQKLVTIAERACIATNTLKQGTSVSAVLESAPATS